MIKFFLTWFTITYLYDLIDGFEICSHFFVKSHSLKMVKPNKEILQDFLFLNEDGELVKLLPFSDEISSHLDFVINIIQKKLDNTNYILNMKDYENFVDSVEVIINDARFNPDAKIVQVNSSKFSRASNKVANSKINDEFRFDKSSSGMYQEKNPLETKNILSNAYNTYNTLKLFDEYNEEEE